MSDKKKDKKRRGKALARKNRPPLPPSALPECANPRELEEKALFRGFVQYVQRPGTSYRDIWESERITEEPEAPLIRDCITWAKFERRAQKGKWRIRRNEHWREIQARVLEHAKSKAVEKELEEIADLETLKLKVLEWVRGDESVGGKPVGPKSLEGAIGAFVQADKRIGSKRKLVSEGLAEAASRPITQLTSGSQQKQLETDVPLEDDLSDDEIEAMARALAEKRAGLEENDLGDDSKSLGDILPDKGDNSEEAENGETDTDQTGESENAARG